MDQNKLIEAKKSVGAHWKLQIIVDMLIFWHFTNMAIIPSNVEWLICNVVGQGYLVNILE
jgi:hypothetical protein